MRIGILGLGLMGGEVGMILAPAGDAVAFRFSRCEDKLKRLAGPKAILHGAQAAFTVKMVARH